MLEPWLEKGRLEAGCDEAGRGCLAGPVVAAAVILPPDFRDRDLDDSKKLSAKKRDRLRPLIEREALAWAVGVVSEQEIDQINILNASFEAMHRALDGLETRPDFLLIDGNRFKPWSDVEHLCVVGGDGKYASIAAASVLAKTWRDAYMVKVHEEFPVYGWDRNKGYGSTHHRKAIAEHGVSPHHRHSFRLIDEQMKLDF